MSREDDRPAGGTARHQRDKSGSRRVQWLDNIRRPSLRGDQDSRERQEERKARSESSQFHESEEHQESFRPHHSLDERGHDPQAFNSLTRALERHKSASPELDGANRAQHSPSRRESRGAHFDSNQDSSHLEDKGLSADTSASDTGGVPTENTTPASPVHVPGHFIDSHETAGLPGTDDLERYASKQAAQVVRAHTARKGRKGGFGLRKKKRSSSRNSGTYSDSDVEKYANSSQSANPSLPAGGGILSALLTLYNDSGATQSAASTPGTSTAPSRDTRKSTSPGIEPRKHRETASWDSLGSALGLHTPVAPLPAARANKEPSLLSRRAQAPLSLLGLNNRPPQTRSSGGVLGPLIASTGNIAGAAAPHSSRIAPNVKRPGYHLSKYSLEEVPTSKRRPPQVPSYSAPTTPGVHEDGSPASPTPTTAEGSPRSGTYTPKKKLTGYASSIMSGLRSGRSSPNQTPLYERNEYFSADDEKAERRKRRRKKAEVYITRHVAQIIQRQEFILKMTRAFMMFGAPSHRLQAQIQATASVLDITLSCMYLPDVVLISFEDPATGTSQLKFMRQASTLDLSKVEDAYKIYSQVIHDQLSVSEASILMDDLMRKKEVYNWWQLMIIGGFCSAAICTVSFNGSFLDCVVVFPLGAILVGIQLLSVKHALYSNVFEITVAMLFSFCSAAIASSSLFCYSALASSSIVLILPGFFVTIGALEIVSRNIVPGVVRLGYAVVYSLFLGFGLALGATAYEAMTGIQIIGTDDTSCNISHPAGAPWYQVKPSQWWWFLTVPAFPLFLSMRNFAKWNRKEIILMVLIGCIGRVSNYYTSTKFPNQSDVTAAVGAFAVGFVANLYTKFFGGSPFVIMVAGILFQVPSGLGNGGLLTFVSQQTRGEAEAYNSGFRTAMQLVSVAIGLTVGLGISLVVVHPVQSRKRAAGVFSL